MSWQTPKTNWQVEDVPGVGDFNRIEGNIAALESGEVMPRGVLLRVVPSDEVILESNTRRGVYVDDGNRLVKEFALKYPGIYRFKCEVRNDASTTGSVTVSVSGGSDDSVNITIDDYWQPINFEISTGLYGSVVRVSLRSYGRYTDIRNVKICGTLTMAEPEYAVLRN